MNQRINTVRQYAPNAIVMVYQQGIDQLESGAVPDYTQKNIIFDTHIYKPNWSPTDSMPLVNFARAHGQAVIVGEWGGVPGKPDPFTMIPFVKDNNLAACYFIANDLLTGNATNPTGLNSIGQAVASGYGTIVRELRSWRSAVTQAGHGRCKKRAVTGLPGAYTGSLHRPGVGPVRVR